MTVNEKLNMNDMEDELFPLDYIQFCVLSDEEKRWFISELRDRFNATDGMIATMFGVSRPTVSRWASRLELEDRSLKEDIEKPKKEFFDWVEQKRACDSVEEKPKHLQAAPEPEEDEPEEWTHGNLKLYSNLGDVAAMIQALATRDNNKYVVTVQWNPV